MGIEPVRSNYIPCDIQVLQDERSRFATISPSEGNSGSAFVPYTGVADASNKPRSGVSVLRS